MKIRCLDEIYLSEFSLLLAEQIILCEKDEDDGTYKLELDTEKNPFINVHIMHELQNNITNIMFVDTRAYQHASFSPISINLPRESYVSIELW